MKTGKGDHMKLQDILSIINESSTVNVWKNGEVFTYDGKNSIPDELNTETVNSISAGYYLITIEL